LIAEDYTGNRAKPVNVTWSVGEFIFGKQWGNRPKTRFDESLGRSAGDWCTMNVWSV
jgi:hypothetical protein